ncbi:MAG TPA: DUF2865 domain-containing protein [Pseudolabrys sp.]|nr:DUF2865 domain-containing protein [Pseudolabrys sp.]
MGERTKLAAAAGLLMLSSAVALAQQPPPASPACARLEAQLASLDRGPADPARAEQAKRYEDALNKQQFDLDRLVAQSRRLDCQSSGFFSIFNTPPAQCAQLTPQIQKLRDAIDRTQADLQRAQGNTLDRAEERRGVLMALGDNNCGPQYRSAALRTPGGPGSGGGFFETLFGGGGNRGGASIFAPAESQSSTYRTICVRSCDGYYYPISFATVPGKFRDDEQVCQRTCPAAEVQLYTYRNPGEEVSQAVSLSGKLYTELPNAFKYRQALDSSCSCRHAGQSWADALKQLNDNTVEQGDIVVNEERAKRMSQPLDARGRPLKPDPRAAKAATATAPSSAPATADSNDDKPIEEIAPGKRTVRTVGPTFYPVR